VCLGGRLEGVWLGVKGCVGGGGRV
jgi:hypothetical protein